MRNVFLGISRSVFYPLEDSELVVGIVWVFFFRLFRGLCFTGLGFLVGGGVGGGGRGVGGGVGGRVRRGPSCPLVSQCS